MSTLTCNQPPSLPCRNVTIEGPAAADPPVTLDLAFKRAVIILCPTCTVTLKQLVLKNGRRGSGAPLDFFAGDENAQTAAVLLKDVWRLRLACPPGDDVGEVVKNTPRSRVLPQPKGKQQVALEAVTFQVCIDSKATSLPQPAAPTHPAR